MAPGSIDEFEAALREADHLPDRGLTTALYLSLALEKPVLLEGDAGVGKTEAAKALATALDARLIRLQCYEGLDVAHAVYEWNDLAGGMRAALPFVDRFLAGHNLRSLEELATVLAGVERRHAA